MTREMPVTLIMQILTDSNQIFSNTTYDKLNNENFKHYLQ